MSENGYEFLNREAGLSKPHKGRKCPCRKTIPVRVKIPADLSHTRRAYRKAVGIDPCIAPLVKALQVAGIDMRGSCCGHGRAVGEIVLADGRTLFIARKGRKARALLLVG
jgi:hypothetical protein